MSFFISLFFLVCVSIFVVVFVVVYLFKMIGYIYSYFFWGAINVPTTEKRVEQMIGFLDFNPVKKAVDLGAGDGRLVIALAKAGFEAHGYEINPFLISLARKNIREAGLENKAFVHFKNLWKADLGEFDAVVLYGMKHMMKKLEKKLEKELKPGVKIVSNYFTFPIWKPEKMEDNIYLYIKK